MSWVRTILALAFLLPAFCGCRKELCYNHDEHSFSVKVHIIPEWEQEWERKHEHDWVAEWKQEWKHSYNGLRPEVSDGIRAVIYKDGKYYESNHSSDGGRLPLQEGVSDILLYNNDTEYLVFNNISASASASVTTRTLSRGSFKELHAGERTMNQPDMLYGHFIEGMQAVRTLEKVELPVTLRPLVYKYMVRYEFSKGLEYVALARGAIAGMAESVFLMDGHTGKEAATIMYDCTLEDFGAEAVVATFGVPDYPGDHYSKSDGKPASYSLNLEVRLENGKFKTFEFDITDQLKGQPRGGVIVVNGLEVTEDEGQAGSGGFDPEVDGWGDYIDVPLPI